MVDPDELLDDMLRSVRSRTSEIHAPPGFTEEVFQIIAASAATTLVRAVVRVGWRAFGASLAVTVLLTSWAGVSHWQTRKALAWTMVEALQ